MTQPLSWTIVVSDGETLRTLHPPTFDRASRELLDGVIRDRVFGPATDAPRPTIASRSISPGMKARLAEVFGDETAPAKRADIGSHDPTLTQREAARASGYTGNMCDGCGGFSMRRSGTCETCDACGTTSGGCS